MEHNRREFLKGAAWMGAAAMAAGCMGRGAGMCGIGGGEGAPMHGFSVPPMKRVRVGVIGVGSRGTAAVHRLAQIPGCEVVALSDINPARLDAAQKWLKEHGHPAAREWSRDGRFLYPPRSAAQPSPSPVLDGPVDTYRIEMLRDGIEDYEYFAMLKRLLAKRRKIPQNLRNSAESLLKVPTSVYTSMTEFTTDPKPMETHRERLARAIESVQRY